MGAENNADQEDEDKWGRRRRASSSGMSNAAQWAIAMGIDAGAAVCSFKVCPIKCAYLKPTGEENLQDFLGDATEEDLQASQSWAKKVKKPTLKSWFPWKKICKKDAACVAANAKCAQTMATLHKQLASLTTAADAAAKAKDAAKGDSAKAAAAA